MNVLTENLPQPINVNNLSDIEARAQRVSTLLRKSAVLWLDIAREVHDAKQSLTADDYAVFLNKSCLTPAIADKMPTIAKTTDLYSKEIKKHIHRFDGWSPIYETAKLNQNERNDFIHALNNDPVIEVSRKYIQSFRKTKSTKSASTFLIAEIRFNESDLQRFDYNHLIELRQKLDDISRIIDRMPQAVLFKQKDDKLNHIEAAILNSCVENPDDNDQHCDQSLPVTMLAANTDSNFLDVAN